MTMSLSVLAAVVVVSTQRADTLQEPDRNHNEPVASGNSLAVPGDWDYCTDAAACGLGFGDCDWDSQCQGDLVCGTNNCLAMNPNKPGVYNSGSDCCEPWQPLPLFHIDYCWKLPGGCGYGEGDCDGNGQCKDGLICGYNNCRAMHPHLSFAGWEDCCVSCGGVFTVQGGATMFHPSTQFTGRQLVSAERTLANPPTMLETSDVYSLPALVSGDGIKLECCASKGEPCNFFVAVYHCPPCSHKKNGGIPAFLASEGWMGSSCAPIFTPTGSSQSQTMTVFHKTLAAGEVFDIPVTGDAPHVAVFSITGVVDADWCPKKATATGTTGPHRPCVCLA